MRPTPIIVPVMPPSHPQSSRDSMVNAAVPSPSPQSDAVLHPHLPHQSKEAADKSFPPLSHSHSKEVFPQSAAAPLPCPQSATRPSDQPDFSFRTLSVPSPPRHHPHSSRREYLLSENYVRPSVRTLMKPVMKWRPTDMNNFERACHRTLRLGFLGIPFELCDCKYL